MASAQAFSTSLDRIGWSSGDGSLWLQSKARRLRDSVSALMQIQHCVAMDVERQKHQSLFARGRLALVKFCIQDPTELAPFVRDCCKACKE